MYIVKNYLTDETVAVVSRKEDAIALPCIKEIGSKK